MYPARRPNFRPVTPLSSRTGTSAARTPRVHGSHAHHSGTRPYPQQPHVLILTNCSSTQTSSSRSRPTCLASASRSRLRILAPASPTTSHARSCNRRTEELQPGAATGGQRSYKPGTKPTTAVLESTRRGAATGRSKSYNCLLFLLGPVRNFAATIHGEPFFAGTGFLFCWNHVFVLLESCHACW